MARTEDYSPERYLFDAARRHCIEGNLQYLSSSMSDNYQTAYRWLLQEIEKLDPWNLPPVEALQTTLLSIGELDSPPFRLSADEVEVIETGYRRAIELAVRHGPDYTIAPLFTRTRLSDIEESRIYRTANARWEFNRNRFWYPYSAKADLSLCWCASWEFNELIGRRAVQAILSARGTQPFYWISAHSEADLGNLESYRYSPESAERLQNCFMFEHPSRISAFGSEQTVSGSSILNMKVP